MKFQDASLHLAQQIARAKRAIAVERAVPALLPALLVIGGWATIALFGLQDRLPPLIATLSAVLALAAACFLLYRGARGYRKPTDQDARERLARDVNLDAHAFDALEDRPSRLDPLGLALWEREQGRALEAASTVDASPPRPALKRVDPLYLRFILPIALICALFVAGLQAPDRLARAFIPDPGPLLGDGVTEIEAWLVPADYTGEAPLSLSDKIGKSVPTAPQAEATVRVTGPVGAPFLIFSGGGKKEKVRFAKAADGVWEAKIKMARSGALRVVRFHTKARWAISTRADVKPRANFVMRPKIEKDKVVFSWKSSDDYGVRDMLLRIRPLKPPPGLKDAPARDVPIDAPTSDPKTAEGEAELDLYNHPYAGLEVEVRVVARDALSQEGLSTPAKVKLPERIFLQPLAKAAVEIRREILWERRAYAPAPKLRSSDKPPLLYGNDILFGAEGEPIITDEYDPRIERAPAAIRRAGRMIDALTAYPQDGYFTDIAVFMGFKGARAALNVSRDIDDTDQAADILWQVAMRAEYGDSADARRALMEAQRALSQAIENGASKEEIERLTQAMRQAMQNYMQALVQEAMRNGESQKNQEDTRQQTTMTGSDLQDILDEIQRRAEAGDAEGAQQLMQQLQQMLENMEIQLGNQSGQGQGQGGGQQQQQGDSELSDSIEGLSDAIGRQRALRDETDRKGQSGSRSGNELGERQGQLRRDLEELRRRSREAGPDGEDLGRAEQNMREAEDALRRGDLEGAAREQDEALRDMRSGADRLAQELLRREEERNGRRNANDKRENSGERDPLNRQVGAGGSSGDETAVPEAVERQRARDILDELRRRAQDPRRPESEREYLRRLLDRFSEFDD